MIEAIQEKVKKIGGYVSFTFEAYNTSKWQYNLNLKTQKFERTGFASLGEAIADCEVVMNFLTEGKNGN